LLYKLNHLVDLLLDLRVVHFCISSICLYSPRQRGVRICAMRIVYIIKLLLRVFASLSFQDLSKRKNLSDVFFDEKSKMKN